MSYGRGFTGHIERVYKSYGGFIGHMGQMVCMSYREGLHIIHRERFTGHIEKVFTYHI